MLTAKPFVRRIFAFATVAAVTATALTGCGAKPSPDTAAPNAANPGSAAPATKSSTELVVYSGRNEKLMQPVIAAFEQKTGIKVKLRSGSATELAAAILEEKRNPKADVYIANDAGALEKLRMEQALEPHLSDAVKAVPEDLRAKDGSWTAVTARSRVIMYNKKLVKDEEAPKSVFDLADPKWKGQIAMANGTNESVIANVTSLILSKGEAATETFLKGLKANGVTLLKGHSDVRKAVGKGEFKLGWVNHYYAHQQLAEKENNEIGIVYPDQGPKDMGAVMNISGVAVVKGAKNLDNAKTFVDFLLSPEAQKLYAVVNFEMPVIQGVPVAQGVKPLSDYKVAKVSLSDFGANWDKSVQLIDKVNLVTK